jgi:redox-sensitive bicupin YhaK (pirin superfamily)
MTASPPHPAGWLFRPAAERFHSRLDWLDSWHSFSFASHFDPAWRGFGPLLVINDDTIGAGQGFGPHPHREMEIITVMVEGQLNHQDSIGHRAVLRAGEVQCMSAGTGVVHSEINGGEGSCRLLQIWIEPDRHGLPPTYAQKSFPQDPGWTLLLDPEGSSGALTLHRQARVWRGWVPAHATVPVPVPPGQGGWIQMISGAIELRWATGPLGPGGVPTSEEGTLALAQGDGLGMGGGAGPPLLSVTAGPRGADLLWFALS